MAQSRADTPSRAARLLRGCWCGSGFPGTAGKCAQFGAGTERMCSVHQMQQVEEGAGVSFSSTCARARARVRVTEGWVCLSVCLCASVHVCVCLCLAGWPAVHVSEGWVCARARACVSSGGSPCSWMQQKQTHQINGQLLHQTPVTNVLEARHCERQRRQRFQLNQVKVPAI